MPYVQILGKIIRFELLGKAPKQRLVATFSDGDEYLELVWFKGIKWLQKTLLLGPEYVVFGKPTEYNQRLNIAHPEVELNTEANRKLNTALQPLYNSGEILKNQGLDTKGLLKLQRALLDEVLPQLHENLPPDVVLEAKLLPHAMALEYIHFPPNEEALAQARHRLKFEELFFNQLKMLRSKAIQKAGVRGFVFDKVGDVFNTFYKEYLPFALTNAQKRVIKEIRADVGSGRQMNRLLQGDVGSGKTLVALLTMLLGIDNGFQACLMAPTEILATQHYHTLVELLKDMPVNIRLLTGSTKKAVRDDIHQSLLNGTLNILIGTHALLEESVQFANLGFVVIDEQHRFGVEQRSKLWKKNANPPHILIMSATPIPRTLAMTVYGDLDLSVIDEMPPGRKPITTQHWFENGRLKLFGFMADEIAKGRQVYVVYPLIEESEKLDLKNLQEGFEAITRAFPAPKYHVSIVHGKQKAADKEFEMQRFVKGETQIMVATTVIEVGVNVPNASVMVIENAERFGLSQLHQLRGRVGRGAEQSFCILMSDYKLSQDSKIRLNTMVRTNDGFEIAEVDMKLRGPGDMSGTQQSGTPDLKLVDLSTDQQLLSYTRSFVNRLLEVDHNLQLPQHQATLMQLNINTQNSGAWSRIS